MLVPFHPAAQERFARLQMNCHPPVVQYATDCLSRNLSQVRAALCQTVEKFRQNLVGRDQPHLPKRVPSANCLATILIVWVECCAPVKRVREDQLHFLFGALWSSGRDWRSNR